VPEDHPIQQLRGSAVFVEGPEIHRYGAAVTVNAGVVSEVVRCTGRIEHCRCALKQAHEFDIHAMMSCCFSLVTRTVQCVLSLCEGKLCFCFGG
jgi:hypothetical protein